MVRLYSALIGVGLLIVAIVGWATHGSTWLGFADLCAAFWSFIVATVVHPGQKGKLAVGMPAVMSMSILIIWLCALAAWLTGGPKDATPWMLWLTFAAAVAFGFVARAAMPSRPQRYPGYARLPRA